MPGGRHVYETLGMTRVVIEDGKVVEVGQPELEFCPLFKKYCDIDALSPEKVRENMEFRIRDFGFCTEDRVVRAKDYVTFGVSEIMSTALEKGDIDAAVIAADGCGTAVITEPALLQGLCGRISGLVETSPLKVVLDAVGRDNVLDPETVPLDMVRGAELAHSKGYRRFAVTVSKPDDAEAIRKAYGPDVLIVGVHTSHVTCGGVSKLFDNCDIITACASGRTRAEAEKRKVLVAGSKVQIFGVSDFGRRLVLQKLESIGRKPYDGEPKEEPRPLIFWGDRGSRKSDMVLRMETIRAPMADMRLVALAAVAVAAIAGASIAVLASHGDDESEPVPPSPPTPPSPDGRLAISTQHGSLIADFADTEAASGLRSALASGDITVRMSDYGGFEKVGDLDLDLKRSDSRIRTEPGDVMLYSGDSLVIFYGTNTYSYTRLAVIDADADEIKAVLGAGDVDVVLSLVLERPGYPLGHPELRILEVVARILLEESPRSHGQEQIAGQHRVNPDLGQGDVIGLGFPVAQREVDAVGDADRLVARDEFDDIREPERSGCADRIVEGIRPEDGIHGEQTCHGIAGDDPAAGADARRIDRRGDYFGDQLLQVRIGVTGEGPSSPESRPGLPWGHVGIPIQPGYGYEA